MSVRAVDLVAYVSSMMGWGDTVTTIEGEVSTEVGRISRVATAVLRDLQSEQNWPELRVPDYKIMLQASITGTSAIAATQGEDTITFDPDISGNYDLMVGGLLKFPQDGKTTYRIVEYISGTNPQFRLDKPWRDDSVTLDLTDLHQYVYGRTQYQVPSDYDRCIEDKLLNESTGNYIKVVGMDELRAEQVANGTGLTSGEPTMCSYGGRAPNGALIVHFDAAPDDDYIVAFPYQREHPEIDKDNVEILYPSRYLLSIYDAIRAQLARDVDVSSNAAQIASDAMKSKVRASSNPGAGMNRMRMTPLRYRTRSRRRR